MPFEEDKPTQSFISDDEEPQKTGFIEGIKKGILQPAIETVVKPVAQAIAAPWLKGAATIAELPLALSYNKALDTFQKNPIKENLDNLQLEENALLFLREGIDWGFFGKAQPAKTEKEAFFSGVEAGSSILPVGKAGPIAKAITRGKVAAPVIEGAKGGFQAGLVGGVARQGQDELEKPLEERVLEVGLETLGGTAVGGIAGGVAAVVGKGIMNILKVRPDIDPIIDEAIEKGIRPTVVSKKTSPQYKKYQADARVAVKAVANNKKNLTLLSDSGEEVVGELPKTLKQFSDAIYQTKTRVFQMYDKLTKQAGGKGAVVDTRKISQELLKITEDPKFAVIEDQSPKIADYVLEVAGRLEKRGSYSTEQAQAAIKNYNDALEAFYKNPSYESASKAAIDAMVVNNIRKELDDVITTVTGKEYSSLKKLYGSLRSIESDVGHRVIIDARKNVKGLIDFSDVFSSGQVVSGILSMNPAQISQGLIQKAVAGAYKKFNDPNRIIENMFKQIGK